MRKQFKSIVALSGLSVVLLSCSSYSKMTTRNNKVDYIKTISPITYPVVMDLEIDLTKKAKGTSSGTMNYQLNETYYKELALSNAIIQEGCDILIEPTYTVTKTNTSTGSTKKFSIEVEVVGYPAYFKNPRKIEAKDTSMINFMNSKRGNGPTPVPADQKKLTKIY